jgi:hypothetical protein
MLPTSSAYLFYGAGSYVGLHVDLRRCEVILLTSVMGNLPPLRLHPRLAGTTPKSLLDLGIEVTQGLDDGEPMPSALLGPTALRGVDIPHHRPTCGDDESGVVATLCYQSAF